MVAILDLPVELTTLRILWLLNLGDIVACQLTHRSLYAVIKDSVQLKYLRALKAAGMQDNRVCTVGSMSKRLRMLNLQEEAWETHQVDFSRTITIPTDKPFLENYGFNGGMSFFRDLHLLHFLSLPLKASDEIHWSLVNAYGRFRALGYAIYEHDLVATLIPFRKYDEDAMDCILLYQASTGKSHPLARHAGLDVIRSNTLFGSRIKIVGDYLALVATFGEDREDGKEYIDIYNWKTGDIKMTIESTEDSYGDILFLSPKVLLAPNRRNNTFELWNIPESPEYIILSRPNKVLALPPLKDHWSMDSIWCKCAPFFELHRTRRSSVPFYASAADAIAVFNIVTTVDMDFDTDSAAVKFSLIVHFKSLLDLCPTSPLSPERSSGEANIVPWDKWGPAATRLQYLKDEGMSSMDLSDRCVLSSRNEETVILNFNSAKIYSQVNATTPEHTEAKREDMSGLSLITSESLLDCACFEKPVISRLPYIRQIFQNAEGFRVVFIDSERLVGYRYHENSKVDQIKIWHIGQADSVVVPKIED